MFYCVWSLQLLSPRQPATASYSRLLVAGCRWRPVATVVDILSLGKYSWRQTATADYYGRQRMTVGYQGRHCGGDSGRPFCQVAAWFPATDLSFFLKSVAGEPATGFGLIFLRDWEQQLATNCE